MITDTIPQLRDMRMSDKFQLAVELWDDVLQHEDQIENPPGLAAMLEQRLADYRSGQTTGKSWNEVRAAIPSRRQS